MYNSDLGTGTSICYSVCVILELMLFIIKQWWNSNSLEIFKEFWWKFWLLRWGIPPRFFFNKWTWLIDLNSDTLMEGFTNQERSGCMITEMFNKWGCLTLEIKFSKKGRSVVGFTPWMTLCWFGGMPVDYWSYFCQESVLRSPCQFPGQLWVYSVVVPMISFCSFSLDFTMDMCILDGRALWTTEHSCKILFYFIKILYEMANIIHFWQMVDFPTALFNWPLYIYHPHNHNFHF